MKKHILCLGDSNTHGYCADPGDCDDSTLARFNEEERWTCLLQRALGDAYLVIEEGLSGRTTVFEDPLNEGMPALPYLAPCLKSHEPVSLDRKSTRLNFSHTLFRISYAVFCLDRKSVV